ncbi:hypothetical protein H310_01588 [Aphanomyces invadans]|uniref:Myb-like domain-containing protein n=1 Tax=Aphanomyces invadans TaxID=157072 RepID=A0A024US48_9STRA|nr:hypothetical protein H310_01588 [Aphanomyces invadans]ETW09154.1 hypothetical protein H310_01588 [Aphanomyces invadans]|eukprot:XP_008862959.1 hypothetical protein H310_01588 [Aphanomyces invadans]
MGDVSDILGGLSGASGGGTTPPPSKGSVKEEKPKNKFKGLHREVLLLQESKLGGGVSPQSLGRRNHVSIMPGNNLPMKKSLLSQRPGLRNKWVRRDFLNAARTDGLVLTHWVKSSLPETLEYPFARFNVTIDLPTCCTKDEFDKILGPDRDPMIPTPWTFSDTTYLWELCKRYELRWVVIADRFVAPSKVPRSMEDIKYWYYEVVRLLAEARQIKRDHVEVTKVEVAATTPAPVAEPAPTDEIKAEPVDDEAKVSNDASNSSPSGPTSTPQSAPPPSSHRFPIAYEKHRKATLELLFNRSNAEETAIKKLQEELRQVEQQLKKAVLKVDAKKKKELADARTQISCDVPGSGVYFRSTSQVLPAQKMGLSAKLVKKMSLMLEEFGVPARPMPTKPVCDLFDKLRQDILSLFALRKALAAKVHEVQVMSDKLTALTGVPHVPRATVHIPDTFVAADAAAGTAGAPSSAASTLATPLSAAPGHSSKISQKGGSALKRKVLVSAAAPGSGGAASGKRPKK